VLAYCTNVVAVQLQQQPPGQNLFAKGDALLRRSCCSWSCFETADSCKSLTKHPLQTMNMQVCDQSSK
jgi:hypothetical protein